MKYTIEVTQEDIAKGKRGVPASCPIALAVTRIFNADYVSVYGYGVTARPRNHVGYVTFWLPQEGTDFVHGFDASRDVSPFSFEIELPEGK